MDVIKIKHFTCQGEAKEALILSVWTFMDVYAAVYLHRMWICVNSV